MKFIYSADGEIVGLRYKDKSYYYIKNLQGDVIGILDELADIVCDYHYDAWGQCTISIPVGLTDDAIELANKNPIRYRSYYYDTETELYYLQSRYYNPEWGRFVNEDDVVSKIGDTVHGYNLYSYCFNNPIAFTDPEGHNPAVAIIIGIVACGVLGMVLGANYDEYLAGNAREKIKNPNGNKQPNNESSEELTTKQRLSNAAIGFALGIAVGGVVVSILGAGTIVFGGSATATLPFTNMAGSQAFGIGALAFDFVTMFVLPIFGIETDPIEYKAA